MSTSPKLHLHEPDLAPLNPALIKTPRIHSEADMSHYVAQHCKHFDAIQEHKVGRRRDAINYSKLWQTSGKSHVQARVAIEKLCREEENHIITRDEEKRRAKETSQLLDTMAKRTATMGPPTLNSAIRRNLAADPTQRRIYKEARKKHGTQWEDALRRSYVSFL